MVKFRRIYVLIAVGVGLLFVAPVFLSSFIIQVLLLSYIFAIFAASWDLLYGYSGQVSLGHAFPFGLGAFLGVILILQFGLSLWSSFIAASVLSSLASLVLALPSLRLRGAYLAITTLAILYIAEQVALVVTTEDGYPGFLISWPHPMQRFFNGELLPNYFFILVVALVSLSIMFAVGRSHLGLRLQTIREDVTVAQSFGINVTFHKLLVFLLSSFFAALAGAYYGLYLGVAQYSFFDLSVFFAIVAMVIVGGRASIFGSLIGAILLEIVTLALGTYGSYRLIVYGTLILFFMRFFPDGVISIVRFGTKKIG